MLKFSGDLFVSQNATFLA